MVYSNFLEKCFLDPFLTHLWSKNGPFSKHFGIFMGQNASPRAENGLKTLVIVSQMVESNFCKNTFLTHFSSFWLQGWPTFKIMGFSVGQMCNHGLKLE